MVDLSESEIVCNCSDHSSTGPGKRRSRLTVHGSGGSIAFWSRLCGWLLDLELQKVDTFMLKERDAHASSFAFNVATFIFEQNTILVLHDSAYTENRHVF